jgi:hypothetical protein
MASPVAYRISRASARAVRASSAASGRRPMLRSAAHLPASPFTKSGDGGPALRASTTMLKWPRTTLKSDTTRPS